MEQVAAAIKNDRRNTFVLCSLRDHLTDLASRILVAALALKRLLRGVRGDQGLTGRIVDDLRIDV